jgi:hypothetical protein
MELSKINKIKSIIALGPNTNSDLMLKRMKQKRVDFVRVNRNQNISGHIKDCIVRGEELFIT